MQQYVKNKSIWDQLGVGVSLICVIHCALFPVLLALLPVWPLFDAVHHWAHPVLLMMVVPIAYLSSRAKSSSLTTKILFAVGILLLIFAWLSHDFISPLGEILLTLLASVILIIAHFKNYKYHSLHRTKSSIC